jgi:hypothetical protein
MGVDSSVVPMQLGLPQNDMGGVAGRENLHIGLFTNFGFVPPKKFLFSLVTGKQAKTNRLKSNKGHLAMQIPP